MISSETQSGYQSTSALLARVFGWMALALLITFVVAVGGACLLWYVISPSAYLYIMIGACVLQFILLFVIQFSGILGKRQASILIPFILYSVCMGIMLSSIVAYVDIESLLLTFGATSICFGTMALVGYFSKTNMRVMYLIAIGLLMGALTLGLFNFLFGLITGVAMSQVSWIVSFAIFAFVMMITAIDVWRIRKIAESGSMSKNLAVYCAFHLYYDFIMMSMRILSFVMASRNR